MYAVPRDAAEAFCEIFNGDWELGKAAVGAAAIPSAGLFTMAIVLRAVGLPLEGVALIIGVGLFAYLNRKARDGAAAHAARPAGAGAAVWPQ